MIWLILLGSLAALGQLTFDIVEAIQIRREHKARLIDEQRLTDDEARFNECKS